MVSASVLFVVLIGIVLVLVLVHSLVGQFVVLSLMFVRSWPFVVVPDGVGVSDGVGGGMFVVVGGIVLVLALVYSLVGLFVILLVDVRPFVAVRRCTGWRRHLLVVTSCWCGSWCIRWLACSLFCSLMLVRSWCSSRLLAGRDL